MDMAPSELLRLRNDLHEQAQTRKTVDLETLRAYVGTRANAQQRHLAIHWPTNKDMARMVQTLDEDTLHTLDCYYGYNSRIWEAFVSLPLWHDIVRALQSYDGTHGTRHYWKLLSALEQGHGSPRWYYGTHERFRPLPKESYRARRIHDRWAKVLGLI